MQHNIIVPECADLPEIRGAIMSHDIGKMQHNIILPQEPTGTRSTFQSATSRGGQRCSQALEKLFAVSF